MYIIQCCCVFCLLSLVPSGAGIVNKPVCSEDSIVLFENALDSQDTVVSVYMIHHTHILIAEWEVKNLIIMSHIQPGYEEKVDLSKDGSIWLRNVNLWDEEKYFIVYDRDTSNVKYEVEIHVLVAPTTRCKPKITHRDKILIAFLEGEDCGTPVVSTQWLDHPGISNITEPMINLPPGNDAGTYHACLKGPALKCAKISTLSDYCSSYTIRGNDSPPQSSQPSADISHLKTAFFVMVPFVVCCFLMSAAQIAIQIYEIRRKYFFSGKLTDDKILEQIQKWQEVYPGLFMKKYLEMLMEDHIQKWLNDHPDCLKKALDQNRSHPTNPPTLEELAVTPKEVDNEKEDIPCPLISPNEKQMSPNISGDIFSDMLGNDNQSILQSIIDLGIKRTGRMTEREDNKKQWISPIIKVLSSETSSSSSSDTFSEPGHSGIQPFNMDERDANPEWVMAQAEVDILGVFVKEDSKSKDECNLPLL